MAGKNELVEMLRNVHGLTAKKAKAVVDDVFGMIAHMAYVERQAVQIRGFGTFQAKRCAGRMFVNPQNGQGKQLRDRLVLRFRVSATLKQEV